MLNCVSRGRIAPVDELRRVLVLPHVPGVPLPFRLGKLRLWMVGVLRRQHRHRVLWSGRLQLRAMSICALGSWVLALGTLEPY
jgi:hypothetical protein